MARGRHFKALQKAWASASDAWLGLITGTTASHSEGPAMTRSRQQNHKQTVPTDNMCRVQKRNSPNARRTRLRLSKQKGILAG
uniref:Putative secreted protein n=1 Tax=Ixodes ricinus TaxID=34613 RepID=A0A6B0U6F3_IXORI